MSEAVDLAEQEYQAAAKEAFAGREMAPAVDVDSLGAQLIGEFHRTENQRRDHEDEWLRDLRQWRGEYEADVLSKIGTARSRAFFNKTRPKVNTLDARMMDLLFPANTQKNFSVQATPEVTAPDYVQVRVRQQLLAAAQASGQPFNSITKASVDRAVRQFCEESAQKMETRVYDQLVEGRYRKHAKSVIHDGNTYGTGVMKGGVLTDQRVRTSYEYDAKKKKFQSKSKYFNTPFLGHVPVWRFYPDMSVTEHEDCRFTWEHHRMPKHALAAMAERKGFYGEKIKAHLLANPHGSTSLRNYELELRSIGDLETTQSLNLDDSSLYDVFERWGYLNAEQLAGVGIHVPPERMYEQVYCNLWVLPSGETIRAALQPIEAQQQCYFMYYFEKDETSIFGRGIPRIMRDDQEKVNSAIRMIFDNAAVTAGPMIEYDSRAMDPNEDMDSIGPFRSFRRIGGDAQFPGVRNISIESHIPELQSLLGMLDDEMDNSTLIPKFMQSQNPTSGAASTVGGMSMLMGSANITLKDLVINYDEGITTPLVSGYYHWNMKHAKEDDIKGDFDVVATGASSLVAKEVRLQQLAQFVASVQPEERPYIKWDVSIAERAKIAEMPSIIKSKKDVEEEMASPQAQQQQQLAQMQQQIQMAQLQAQLASMQADVEKTMATVGKLNAEAVLLDAKTTQSKVGAVYAGMQAAGVVATNPAIAPAGDSILQSAGYLDTEQPQTNAPTQDAQLPGATHNVAVNQPQQPEQMMPAPEQSIVQPPESPMDGVQGGIQTAQIEGATAP